MPEQPSVSKPPFYVFLRSLPVAIALCAGWTLVGILAAASLAADFSAVRLVQVILIVLVVLAHVPMIVYLARSKRRAASTVDDRLTQ